MYQFRSSGLWTVGLVSLVMGVAFSIHQGNPFWLLPFLIFGAIFSVRRVPHATIAETGDPVEPEGPAAS